MIDDAYVILRSYKFVDWDVINRGLMGVPGLDGVLQLDVISDFAYERLALIASTSPQLKNVVALATDSSLSSSDVRDLVTVICIAVGVDDVRSMRRWRLAALENLLQRPDEDSVYGMINVEALKLAWSGCRGLVQLPSTEPSYPIRYSTGEHYGCVLSTLREWVRDEYIDLSNDLDSGEGYIIA